MGNGNIRIETKEDFLALPQEERDWLTFRTVDKRLSNLECRKNRDTALAAATGFLGGAAAIFAKMGLGK